MKKSFVLQEAIASIKTGLWFVFLALPLSVVKINAVEYTPGWRPMNLLWAAALGMTASVFWRALSRRKQTEAKAGLEKDSLFARFSGGRNFYLFLLVPAAVFPFVFSSYQINILSTALIYILLALGLNIIVGFGGLLNLGYAAFYAVGAYTYALLNQHFGFSFYPSLVIGALLSAVFGVLLALPVLRLRGDYLAIVTLGFAEILRLFLENEDKLTNGPGGISNIAKPHFFSGTLNLHDSTVFMYLLILACSTLAVFAVRRLENSRIGRAWAALREDEIACESMGINTARIKLSACAIGAAWAGIAGVLFAAKTSFINPSSFTIWESIFILCIVVLGGIASIPGVILASLVLIILPEQLRAFSEYRMLIFGALLVLTMVFKPEGLIRARRKVYLFENKDAPEEIK